MLCRFLRRYCKGAHMPEIPIDRMTKTQLIRYFAERQDRMSEQLDHLNESVDTQLAAAVSQAELIAELKSQLDAAQAAKDAALAGEAQAQTDLTSALDAAEAAADKLDSDDAPAEEPA